MGGARPFLLHCFDLQLNGWGGVLGYLRIRISAKYPKHDINENELLRTLYVAMIRQTIETDMKKPSDGKRHK